MAIKKIFTNWRVLTLIALVILSIIAIRPAPQNEGVSIRIVASNSSANLAGILNPEPNIPPLSRERITSIDSTKIYSVIDFHNAVSKIIPNQTLRIVTNRASYALSVKPRFNETTLNETEKIIVERFDDALNRSVNVTLEVPKVEYTLLGPEDIGIKVGVVPKSNLRKGLDLAGGSRVLLQPEEVLTVEDLETTLESLKQRLNVYGLSDVVVRDATDLAGNKFITVEIAGVTEDEVKNIITSQGKFEAKIGNETVFSGGKKDITYVCRSADCSGLNPNQPCGQLPQGGYGCSFFFQISLSVDAAERQATATQQLDVISDGPHRYLNQSLELFLDDTLVNSLQIAATLKGQAETSIQISGSGTGPTRQEASENALQEMRQLQTVLVTGSLPVKLAVVKIDTVSPSLGERFLRNIIWVAVSALLSVTAVVSIRYRNAKIALPIILTMISEIILILGFAALVGWNLDLAGMAGIIISIGTAVDHLIVITDETLKGEEFYDWKRKLKNAMFIITGAYLTVLAGMVPLWFAGAGLLRGFAFTTIVGVSFGVIIARPAYAAVIEILLRE
jgi:preprotein translocase subunit SecD